MFTAIRRFAAERQARLILEINVSSAARHRLPCLVCPAYFYREGLHG